MTATPSNPIKIFYSYHPNDQKLREQLDMHLGLLKKQGKITTWYDGLIQPGMEYDTVRNDRLNTADLILLLISPDFINSDEHWNKEMQQAMKRHDSGEARVIPIILRPVHWEDAPFGKLQSLPTKGKPITTWSGSSGRDKAFQNVVEGIREVVETLLPEKPESEPVESSSPSTRPSTPIPLPPTHRNPLRKKRWLLVAIVTFVVLLGIVGDIIISTLWHPNPTPSVAFTAATETAIAACAAVPTLTGPIDGQTLNSRTVILTWQPPQDCIPEGYTVRINTNEDPEAKPWIVDTGWRPSYYRYTFTADGTYYWHIRACLPCTPFHPGNWAIRSFTIHTKSTP